MNFSLNQTKRIFWILLFKTISILTLLTTAPSQAQELFGDLRYKEYVTIGLKDYNLERIPDEIGQLRNVKKLTISQKSDEWTIFSISPWDEYPDNPLTVEIGKLTKLKVLSLYVLNLTSLPDEIVNLQSLDTLRLPGNHLDMSLEMDKLKQLPNLKFLDILGNKIDNKEIKVWLQENPNLYIEYALDTIR